MAAYAAFLGMAVAFMRRLLIEDESFSGKVPPTEMPLLEAMLRHYLPEEPDEVIQTIMRRRATAGKEDQLRQHLGDIHKGEHLDFAAACLGDDELEAAKKFKEKAGMRRHPRPPSPKGRPRHHPLLGSVVPQVLRAASLHSQFAMQRRRRPAYRRPEKCRRQAASTWRSGGPSLCRQRDAPLHSM